MKRRLDYLTANTKTYPPPPTSPLLPAPSTQKTTHPEPPKKPIILSEALVWAAVLAIAAPLGYDVRWVEGRV